MLGCTFSLLALKVLLQSIHFPDHVTNWYWTVSTRNIPLYRPDRNRIYAFWPNVSAGTRWSTDANAFRKQDHPKDASHSATIITVGDSITYGYQVTQNQTYPFFLERGLTQSSRPAIVYNAAVPGYGIDPEYIYIINELLPTYHPDMIIWNVFDNDLTDSEDACLFMRIGQQYRQIPAFFNIQYLDGKVTQSTNPVIHKSRLIRFFIAILSHLYGRTRATIGCTPLSRNGDWPQTSQKIQYLLKHALTALQKTHTKLVMTLMPDEEYFDSHASETHVEPSAYRLLKETIKKSGATFVDLNETLIKNSTPSAYSSLFLRSDEDPFYPHHLSALGHSAVANALLPFIQNLLKH